MDIRKSCLSDLERMLQIYAYAREQMKKNGNPTQWGDNRPSKETLIQDIEQGNSYVLEENGRICGVFSFILGDDSTYCVIEEGHWLNNEPYGTIHRVASDGTEKGVLDSCLHYCEAQVSNVRIDTHHDNFIMQHILEKNGFQHCGIIHLEDGSPRIAYQKQTTVQ